MASGSARADEVSSRALRRRAVHTGPDVHSVFFCDLLGPPWDRALTWDPAVVEVVLGAIKSQ